MRVVVFFIYEQSSYHLLFAKIEKQTDMLMYMV